MFAKSAAANFFSGVKMFWNKTNSKRIDDLATEMSHIRLQLQEIKLDLALYVKKLKASKGLKDKETDEEQEPTNIKDSTLLPIDGLYQTRQGINSSKAKHH